MLQVFPIKTFARDERELHFWASVGVPSLHAPQSFRQSFHSCYALTLAEVVDSLAENGSYVGEKARPSSVVVETRWDKDALEGEPRVWWIRVVWRNFHHFGKKENKILKIKVRKSGKKWTRRMVKRHLLDLERFHVRGAQLAHRELSR